MTLTDSEAFLSALEAEVRAHPAVLHPFLHRFAEGGLSRLQLWAFALQHYQLVRVFTLYLESLLRSVADEEVRGWLNVILTDEFARPRTYEHSHPALYRKFLRALGLSEQDWETVHPLPETEAFIKRHIELTSLRHPVVGLGAVGPGHEWSIPIMFTALVEGLRKSGIEEGSLEYFTLHVTQDLEHGRLLRQALARYADTEVNRARILEGARASLEARRLFWDGLHRTLFQELV